MGKFPSVIDEFKAKYGIVAPPQAPADRPRVPASMQDDFKVPPARTPPQSGAPSQRPGGAPQRPSGKRPDSLKSITTKPKELPPDVKLQKLQNKSDTK